MPDAEVDRPGLVGSADCSIVGRFCEPRMLSGLAQTPGSLLPRKLLGFGDGADLSVYRDGSWKMPCNLRKRPDLFSCI